jgi:hypothetical protein
MSQSHRAQAAPRRAALVALAPGMRPSSCVRISPSVCSSASAQRARQPGRGSERWGTHSARVGPPCQPALSSGVRAHAHTHTRTHTHTHTHTHTRMHTHASTHTHTHTQLSAHRTQPPLTCAAVRCCCRALLIDAQVSVQQRLCEDVQVAWARLLVHIVGGCVTDEPASRQAHNNQRDACGVCGVCGCRARVSNTRVLGGWGRRAVGESCAHMRSAPIAGASDAGTQAPVPHGSLRS